LGGGKLTLLHPLRTLSPMTNNALVQPLQLTLLDASHVPLKVRLDDRTRRLGLSEVARCRSILDDQLQRLAEMSTIEPLFIRAAA
jgi:hypothetical protein